MAGKPFCGLHKHKNFVLVTWGILYTTEIGLGISLSLTCQQQSRLNYKRRMYSDHMEGAPQVSSLGDMGGCATGPYRTPATLGHTNKTQSQRSST